MTSQNERTCYHPTLQINDDGICCDCGQPVPARKIINSYPDRDVMLECPAPDNTNECAMARERVVAGVNMGIPDCPIHGEWTGEEQP